MEWVGKRCHRGGESATLRVLQIVSQALLTLKIRKDDGYSVLEHDMRPSHRSLRLQV